VPLVPIATIIAVVKKTHKMLHIHISITVHSLKCLCLNASNPMHLSSS